MTDRSNRTLTASKTKASVSRKSGSSSNGFMKGLSSWTSTSSWIQQHRTIAVHMVANSCRTAMSLSKLAFPSERFIMHSSHSSTSNVFRKLNWHSLMKGDPGNCPLDPRSAKALSLSARPSLLCSYQGRIHFSVDFKASRNYPTRYLSVPSAPPQYGDKVRRFSISSGKLSGKAGIAVHGLG